MRQHAQHRYRVSLGQGAAAAHLQLPSIRTSCRLPPVSDTCSLFIR